MAKLTYQARKEMSKKSFALPANKDKANPAGKGAYPIEDLAHARNALARVSAYGSSAEQAKVRAKVYARYPELKKRKLARMGERVSTG